ncbi:MAG: phosphoglycerate mutase family protein [Steroidobacteraceae bacterium]|jgi:broad specificity phosphatase PhoE|nr:phosphoglycerate mutase family protein [Steroidobacteraceae bacterium]
MRKEYRSLRRKPFLTPVWIFAWVGLAALVAAGWAVLAASTTIVVVTRHAEKAPDPGDDPPLAPLGEARAQRLAEIFGSRGREHAVDAVYVTQWSRTAQTARPLATRLSIPVTPVPADDLAGLERRLLAEHRGGRVLVVAHSNTVPQLVERLADGGEFPPIADDEYGTAYVVAIPRWSRPVALRIQLP